MPIEELIKIVRYFIVDVVAVPVVRFVLNMRGIRVCVLFMVIFREIIWKSRLQSLGKKTSIYRYVVIHHPSRVSIGTNVSIAEFVHIWGKGGISIGNNVMIASHTVITSQTHDVHASLFKDTLFAKPVVIKDNVWIGSGAIILPGVTIGSGSVVGAGSVVTRDVQDKTVVAGVPAKIIRNLF